MHKDHRFGRHCLPSCLPSDLNTLRSQRLWTGLDELDPSWLRSLKLSTCDGWAQVDDLMSFSACVTVYGGQEKTESARESKDQEMALTLHSSSSMPFMIHLLPQLNQSWKVYRMSIVRELPFNLLDIVNRASGSWDSIMSSLGMHRLKPFNICIEAVFHEAWDQKLESWIACFIWFQNLHHAYKIWFPWWLFSCFFFFVFFWLFKQNSLGEIKNVRSWFVF